MLNPCGVAATKFFPQLEVFLECPAAEFARVESGVLKYRAEWIFGVDACPFPETQLGFDTCPANRPAQVVGAADTPFCQSSAPPVGSTNGDDFCGIVGQDDDCFHKLRS